LAARRDAFGLLPLTQEGRAPRRFWPLGRFAFTPILPMMQADAGLSVAAGGWLASANYLGYLAGSVAAIRVRLAPETAIRSGLLGIGIATLGMMAVGVILPVIWTGILAIMCAAFLVGSTFMVATMTGMQEARHVHGAGAKALMAAMTSAFALGQILGPVLVSFLSGGSGGFSSGLVAACALLLMSAYALARPRPAPRGPEAP
jgi:MFS family permease